MPACLGSLSFAGEKAGGGMMRETESPSLAAGLAALLDARPPAEEEEDTDDILSDIEEDPDGLT